MILVEMLKKKKKKGKKKKSLFKFDIMNVCSVSAGIKMMILHSMADLQKITF